MAATERKVAFCVGLWNADSILYAWTYAKQYFLRKKRGEDGGEVLNPLDKLYVVHVQHSNKKDELKERWDAGGPLLPSLATALASFPHKVVELEKDSDTKVFKVLLEFAEREGIDVMIMGKRESKTMVQAMVPGTKKLSSTSDQFKSRAKCPVLVVRPASARNEKMRIQSGLGISVAAVQQSHQQAAMAAGMSRNASLPMHLKGAVVTATRQADVRRVIIAFDSVAVGRNLARWAFACCLFPDDVVHLVYCSNPKVGSALQKQLSRRSADSVRPADIESITHDLPRIDTHTPDPLRGDAKSDLSEWADENDADLLIVAASSASGLRKTFGTSTSTYLMHHAPCPTLVIPVQIALAGVEPVVSPSESRELRGDTDEEMDTIAEQQEYPSSPGPESPRQPGEGNRNNQGMRRSLGGSLERVSTTSRAWFGKHDAGRPQTQDPIKLQQALLEKDATIEALQEEVRSLKQRLAVLQAASPSRANSFAL